MANLMQIVKEANVNIAEISKGFQKEQDVLDHYHPFYEKIKDQCESLEFFIDICIADIQHNFIGGVTIKKH